MGIRLVPMYLRDAIFEPRLDGSLLVRMREPLEPYPSRLTERLEHWAALAPERVFLARRARRAGAVELRPGSGRRQRDWAGSARP